MFAEDNLSTKRTGRGGLSPMLSDALIDRKASRDSEEDEEIEI